MPVNITTDSSLSYDYTTNDVKQQLVTRNPVGNTSDVFGSLIDITLMSQIMIIKNISAFSIDLTSQTDIWEFIPSLITISPSRQIELSLTKVNPSLNSGGSGYQTGSSSTTGGTGTGMTVDITSIETKFNITTPGLGYAVGNVSALSCKSISNWFNCLYKFSR